MPLIPLEDTFADVINKAQRGRKLTDERLASVSAVSMEDLLAVKAGTPMVPVIRRVARHLRLNPDALEALATKSWYPKLPILARGFAMFNNPFGETSVNSYLIWDTRSKLAAAFDTGVDSTDMVDFAKSEGLRVQMVFLTHTHVDHVTGLPALAAATKAEVWKHEAEVFEFPDIRSFKDNAYFHLAEISIKALLIGGHSPGLTTFFVSGLGLPLAIAGDAVFAGSMGGTVEHYELQRRTIYNRVFALPKDTVIAPGHGPLTSLAAEREHNPFFA